MEVELELRRWLYYNAIKPFNTFMESIYTPLDARFRRWHPDLAIVSPFVTCLIVSFLIYLPFLLVVFRKGHIAIPIRPITYSIRQTIAFLLAVLRALRSLIRWIISCVLAPFRFCRRRLCSEEGCFRRVFCCCCRRRKAAAEAPVAAAAGPSPSVAPSRRIIRFRTVLVSSGGSDSGSAEGPKELEAAAPSGPLRQIVVEGEATFEDMCRALLKKMGQEGKARIASLSLVVATGNSSGGSGGPGDTVLIEDDADVSSLADLSELRVAIATLSSPPSSPSAAAASPSAVPSTSSGSNTLAEATTERQPESKEEQSGDETKEEPAVPAATESKEEEEDDKKEEKGQEGETEDLRSVAGPAVVGLVQRKKRKRKNRKGGAAPAAAT